MSKNLIRKTTAIPSNLNSINPLNLTESVVHACLEAKGMNIAVLDVSDVFDLADHFVIVSGRSDRHVQGICNRIVSTLADEGYPSRAIEGFDDGHWVLVDFGDTIVHIFYEPMREHYDIEGLWLRAKPLDIAKLSEQVSKKEAA